MSTTSRAQAETSIQAACAAVAKATADRYAAIAAADSAMARRIIAANRRPLPAYGMVGMLQTFGNAFGLIPASECKRRAAENILAHRQMRAAGGNSEMWLRAAATYRRMAADEALYTKAGE